jgi:DNA recombination protein RmuC
MLFLTVCIFLVALVGICIFLLCRYFVIRAKLHFVHENLQKLENENCQLKTLNQHQAQTITDAKSKITQLDAQKNSIEFAQKNIQVQFENLANKIFEDSRKKLADCSSADIKTILDPLKAKISDFEKRIETSFNADIKERYSLASQIAKMATQTDKMTQETQKLTRALRGENKIQGAWGELVLAKVLECSGLQNGRDYTLQKSLETNLIPDVVINLPDGKHLVIDAKTSLKHYESYLNTNEKQSLDLFIKSIKSHIKNLSSKEYQLSQKLFNPGFVFMFIPIESAYCTLSACEPELKVFAMQHKIVITSPNSLMAMLQTVASVWKIVEQNKNAAEIARRAGGMYDKFVLFVEEFKKIGNAICQADKSYQEAMNRLKNGSGNLIRRAEYLKGMGVPTAKQISDDLL